MLDGVNVATANYQVGFSLQDRAYESRDVFSKVLIVGVSIYDDVGAQFQASIETRFEGRAKTLVVNKLDNMVDSQFPSPLDGLIRGSIVDDEHLDLVDSRNLPWQPLKRGRQSGFLIETGNLDDKFHTGQILINDVCH